MRIQTDLRRILLICLLRVFLLKVVARRRRTSGRLKSCMRRLVCRLFRVMVTSRVLIPVQRSSRALRLRLLFCRLAVALKILTRLIFLLVMSKCLFLLRLLMNLNRGKLIPDAFCTKLVGSSSEVDQEELANSATEEKDRMYLIRPSRSLRS